MLKVNSKKTMKKLADTSFKSSKMRNFFAIVAISLTAILFTSLFTVSNSLLTSMEESTMRQVGGSAHGTFKYLSKEQYGRLKTHPSIKNISYSVVLGIAENKELEKRPTEIRYANSQQEAKNFFSLPTTGRLPEKDNEIATDTIVLKKLGITPKLGEKVTLEYSLENEKHKGTFTLVGFWEGDKLSQASQAWLNQGYVEKQLEGYNPKTENNSIGTINANVNFSNPYNTAGKLDKIIIDSGYSPDEIITGVNWAYNANNLELGAILGMVIIILMIVFCGYLMISNVFYISVARDIRYYGLLKTIGTTAKQIRFLIRKQALMLCIIAIPIGLILGYFVGVIITPIVLSIINTNVIKISSNPLAFISSALFVILTLIISISKPSKIAAKVSPIEALRSTDGEQKTKKTSKKSSGINLWNMAKGNVFRNKNKTILVTISLSLSLIILNTAYSMANSFDIDKYISGRIGSDFAVGDVSFFNVHINYANQDTLSPSFLKELSAKDGVEALNNIYFAEPTIETDPRFADLPAKAEKELGISGRLLESLINDVQAPMMLQHIYGLDDDVFKKLEVFSGEIDIAKLKSGNYVISAPFDASGKIYDYNVGEKVKLANLDGTSKEFEVLAVANMPNNIDAQHTHPLSPGFFLPSDIFLANIAEKQPMLTTLDVAEEYKAEMESYLSSYVQNINDNMQYASKATYAKEYEDTQKTFKSVGLILSILVAFIGIMNFINTVITSIISRKRELALLESIGMTKKQTQTMLVFEGVFYTALTALLALTIGSAIGYFGLDALISESIYTTTRFTVIPSLLCLPALALISVLVPYISGKNMTKNSVVERLREVE